ncbi:MAG: nucleotidyl transferase AbiEii/AbiGii toxin family protein [Patescibacteria group bacterium]|nr:nucleotidyl transferase AbiEii/AbiGii toxin family protein [Patescibacteria group bacterium]
MITRAQDALHKSWLNRILIEVADKAVLSQALIFKGGTCAGMLGYLDRFSVDLDFDLNPASDQNLITQQLRSIFDQLGLIVKNASPQAPFFTLGYSSSPSERSTIKLSVTTRHYVASRTQTSFFPEIDRYLPHQSIETMFAHKLIALTDRFARHASLAGRDIYDIHHFFLTGQSYSGSVIEERAQMGTAAYLSRLLSFIKDRMTQKVIDQDINLLLTPEKFHQIRKILLPETVSFLNQEIQTLARCV